MNVKSLHCMDIFSNVDDGDVPVVEAIVNPSEVTLSNSRSFAQVANSDFPSEKYASEEQNDFTRNEQTTSGKPFSDTSDDLNTKVDEEYIVEPSGSTNQDSIDEEKMVVFHQQPSQTTLIKLKHLLKTKAAPESSDDRDLKEVSILIENSKKPCAVENKDDPDAPIDADFIIEPAGNVNAPELSDEIKISSINLNEADNSNSSESQDQVDNDLNREHLAIRNWFEGNESILKSIGPFEDAIEDVSLDLKDSIQEPAGTHDDTEKVMKYLSPEVPKYDAQDSNESSSDVQQEYKNTGAVKKAHINIKADSADSVKAWETRPKHFWGQHDIEDLPDIRSSHYIASLHQAKIVELGSKSDQFLEKSPRSIEDDDDGFPKLVRSSALCIQLQILTFSIYFVAICSLKYPQ